MMIALYIRHNNIISSALLQSSGDTTLTHKISHYLKCSTR